MRFGAWALILLLSVVGGVQADDAVRDYYQEPNLNPFKDDTGTKNFETIDPFSGILQLKHNDVSLPGNGGMDINVYRTYNLPQSNTGLYEITAYGLGWNIGYGRLVITTGSPEICSQLSGGVNSLNTNALDNPAFELPDGGREQFYRDASSNNTQYISRNNWRLQCQVNPDSTYTYVVTAPSGTQYFANLISQTSGTNITSYNVTFIQDVHGNSLTLNYAVGYDVSASGLQYPYQMLSSITAPDGREIDFNYANAGTLAVSLSSIVAKPASGYARTWNYAYTLNSVNSSLLTSVTRPDGTAWTYDYWPVQTVTATTTTTNWYGGFLQNVHYPFTQSGYICYEYQKNLVVDGAFTTHYSNAVYRKTLNSCSDSAHATSTDPYGPRLQPSWEYDFSQNTITTTSAASANDVTTVSLPDSLGQIVYTYQGLNAFYPAYQGNLWRVGLLLQRQTFDGTSSAPIETEVDTWGSRVISGDHYQRGGTYYDTDTEVPQLASRTITRGNTAYTTTYDNYDGYGNPLTETETGNQGSRTTNYTYDNDTTHWILSKPLTQTIAGIGTITNAYDPNTGDLLSVNKYGVTTQTNAYYPDGELDTATNARQFTSTYGNYSHGIAQNEVHPEGVNLSRAVSPWGTITSETNGNGHTTTYTYDAMNRVTGITLPRPTSLPTTLTYNTSVTDPNLGNIANNARELDRGNFRQVLEYDGLGRLSFSLASDVPNNTHIQVLYDYDALDRKVFESYPSYTFTPNWDDSQSTDNVNFQSQNSGTIYQYDILNRLTKVLHKDNTFVTYQYNGDDSVVVTDENNNVTTYKYRAYGDPDKKSLVEIDAPENITTSISRNAIDQILSVTQTDNNTGTSYTRSYTYDSRNFLSTITNPETGVTTYQFDDTGNLVSKQVGNSGQTTYVYDGLNRLRRITYPETTTPVSYYDYDSDSNMILSGNANSLRGYQYDENDHLLSETINVGANLYGFTYAYDGMDNLSQILYPLGRTVDYSPDVFGRATQASPYLTGVTYYATGQTKSLTYPNGVVTNYTLDQRQRIQNIAAAQGNTGISNLTYQYEANGNVSSITDGINSQYNRSFIYDGLNRLKTAMGNWGTASYAYDGLGNLTSKSIGADNYVYNYTANNTLDSVTDNNNPLYQYAYDNYGNITSDGNTRNMVFDDAQNLTQASVTNTSTSPSTTTNFAYLYDANNMRVNRVNNGVSIDYVYSKSGNLMAEMQSDISQDVENFFLGSQRIASIKGFPEPAVSAGADQTVTEGTTVTLDGSGTKIPTSAVANYYWQQVSGVPVTINNSQSMNASFTLPQGVYFGNHQLQFQLTVYAYYYQTTTTSANNTYADMYKRCMDIISLGFASRCQLVYSQYSNPQQLLATKTYQATTTVTVQIVDANNDGISDLWEQKYFGSPDAYPPTADPTGDGYTLLQDYELGLDPTVPHSLDKPNGFVVKPGLNQNTIYWMPVDRATSYDLYWSTSPNVDTSSANPNHLSNVTSPYIHTGLQTGQMYYYKLVSLNQCCSTASEEQSAIGNQRSWSNSIRFVTGTSESSNAVRSISIVPNRETATIQNGTGFDLVSLEYQSMLENIDNGTPYTSSPFKVYTQSFDYTSGWGQKLLLVSSDQSTSYRNVAHAVNANGDEIVYMVGNSAGNSQDNFTVYQRKATGTWQLLSTLTLGAQGSVSSVYATIDSQDNIDVLAFIQTTSGGPAELETAKYTAAGGWTELQSLYANGTSNAVVAANQNGGMVASWCEESTGTASLKSLLYSSITGWSQVIDNAGGLPVCDTSQGFGLSNNINVAINNNDQAMLVWFQAPDQIYAQRFASSQISQTDKLAAADLISSGYKYAEFGTFLGDYWGTVVGAVKLQDSGAAYVEIFQTVDLGSAPVMVMQNLPNSGWQVPVTPITSENVSYLTDSPDNLISYKNDIHFFYQGTGIGNGQEIRNTTVSRLFNILTPNNYCSPKLPYGDAFNDLELSHEVMKNNDGFAVIYPTPFPDFTCNQKYAIYQDNAFDLNFYWQVDGIPTSNAGVDQYVNLNDTVTLDGSGSTDDKAIASYAWTQISGPAVIINNSTKAVASFVATTPTWTHIGPYNPGLLFANPVIMQLTVTDADGYVDSSQVKIYVQGDDLHADAGAPIFVDYTQNPPSTISLDGTHSVDFNGNIVSYAWSIAPISGRSSNPPTLTINNPSAPSPTITLPTSIVTSEAYTITLTVTDDNGATSTATTTLELDQTMSVDSGPDQVVLAGSTVTLAGTVSASVTHYNWSEVQGPSITLSDSSLSPTFVAPTGYSYPVVLVFKLYAGNSLSQSDFDVVAITVLPSTAITTVAPPQVTPPPDIVTQFTGYGVPVSIGVATAVDSSSLTLTLSAVDEFGRTLSPPDYNLVNYYLGDNIVTWTATDSQGYTGTAVQHIKFISTTPPSIVPPPDITVQSSSPVFVDIGNATVSDPLGASVTNDAPARFPVGVNKVTWTAIDNAGNVARAVQTVTVVNPNTNQPPIANAGTDQTVNENTTVTLNGTGSSDPDGSIASYQWTQTAGPVVTLTNADTATATFTAPAVTADTNLMFSLVVTDNQGATASASVTITVKVVDTVPPVVTPPPDLSVEATAILTPVDLGTASAYDAVDGPLTATPDQTGPFALGTFTITWTATDAAGNKGTATQQLIVQDTTPPVITAPDDITVSSAVPLAIDLGTATASDIFTPITITNDAPAQFPIGTTTVTWTATDPNGNSATDTQQVTVNYVNPGVVLSVGASSPVTVGAVVPLSAQIVGLTGAYEYRFRINGPATGGNWQILQDYSASTTYNLDTTTFLGKNRVQVQARPAGTTDTPYKDGQTLWVNSTNAATSVTITDSLPNPQYTGTAVTLTAQAAGGSGTYAYQFRIKGPSTNNAWVVIQDYSTNASVTWDTTGILGQTRVQVLAINAGSLDKPVKAGVNVWLNALDALTGVSLSASPASPQAVGTVVTLTAAPTSGGNGTYLYRFRIRPAAGGTWQVLQDWSNSATYAWDTTAYSGSYRLQVQAVNANSTDEPVHHGLTYTVQ